LEISTELDETEHTLLKSVLTAEVMRTVVALITGVVVLLMVSPVIRGYISNTLQYAYDKAKYQAWIHQVRLRWEALPAWKQELLENHGFKPRVLR
jgi:hypothetical protein